MLFLAPLSAFAPALLPDGTPVRSSAAIVIERRTGQVLWAHNAEEPRFPASTTKILTSYILLEKLNPTDTLIAAKDTLGVTGSSLHLKPGEKISVKTALYALILRSGNDVCHTIAETISGSDAKFADLMNETAKELGATKTHFTNPHGLNDPNHVTTALDLANMARAAMENPTFAEVSLTKRKEIIRSVNQKDRLLISRNKFLDASPFATGIKTGFTNDAGHCFVGSANNGKLDVITVVLRSDDWIADTKALTQWAFRNVRPVPPLTQATLPVQNAKLPTVNVRAKEPTAQFTTSQPGETRLEWVNGSPRAPISVGQSLGLARVTGPDYSYEFMAVATQAVEAKPSLFSPKRGASLWYVGVGAALGSVWWMRRRTRTRTYY